MADDYSIRRARLEDLRQVDWIERAAAERFRGTAFAHLADGATLDSSTLQQAIEDNWLFVADTIVVDTAAGRPVGFALGGTLSDCATSGDAWLREVDVLPEHGRRGLGRRLIERIAAEARQRGFRRLGLTTFELLPWNAPMYQRLGFQHCRPESLPESWRKLRQQEAAAGLDPRQRVVMFLDLD